MWSEDDVSSNFVPSFRPPRSTRWQPEGDTELFAEGVGGESGSAAERLRQVLLSSLQMQHVVVLAGSGCSIGAGGPSMYDLWVATVGDEPSEHAARIAARAHHDIDDKDLELFLSRIEALLQIEEDEEAHSFLNFCKATILDMCASFPDEDQLDAHQTFLRRLSRRRARDERLRVFTTNYDLCFETAASLLGLVVLDGFSFSRPRRYDAQFFDYDVVRRRRGQEGSASFLEGVFALHKLHGSVNWARFDESIVEIDEPGPEEACLVYPAQGKFQQSFSQPYLESMARFMAAVREPNTCVLAVGFGFNDDHLSMPLLAAVQSNPHLRLVVVDPDAKSHIDSGRHVWRELAALGESGEDVWFVEAKFGEFASFLPDLKSLSPAEDLARAIRGVVPVVRSQ